MPVFKKGSKLDCFNYRPISLLSNIEKIFQKLMYKRVYNFLTENNIIYDLQFSFRLKFSSSHALINLTKKIKQALDEEYIRCVYLWTYKKLLTLWIMKYCYLNLSAKLDIRGISNNWFKSYFSNRKEFVSINSCDPGLAEINCAVPQSSVLGPLLFLSYINDLNQAVKFRQVHHFADDTNLLYLGKSIKNLNKLVNFNLKNLLYWLNANKTSLNVKLN